MIERRNFLKGLSKPGRLQTVEHDVGGGMGGLLTAISDLIVDKSQIDFDTSAVAGSLGDVRRVGGSGLQGGVESRGGKVKK